MVNYIGIGERSIIKVGSSLMVTIPDEFVKMNGIKKGDKIQARWNGKTDLLLRAKEGGSDE